MAEEPILGIVRCVTEVRLRNPEMTTNQRKKYVYALYDLAQYVQRPAPYTRREIACAFHRLIGKGLAELCIYPDGAHIPYCVRYRDPTLDRSWVH